MRSAGQSQPESEAWLSKPSSIVQRWRSARGVIVPIITLLVGLAFGFMTLLLYGLYVLQSLSSVPPEPPVSVPPAPSTGDIVIQISREYIVNILKPMLQSELNVFHVQSTIQLPLPCNVPVPVPCSVQVQVPPNTRLRGTINNVQVLLSNSDRTGSVQVTTIAVGEVTISSGPPIIGPVSSGNIPMTVNFQTQLFALNGQLTSYLLSATITLNGHSYSILNMMLASVVEKQINQQLQIKTRDLPPGFNYHIKGIRSKPDSLSVTLSATPK